MKSSLIIAVVSACVAHAFHQSTIKVRSRAPLLQIHQRGSILVKPLSESIALEVETAKVQYAAVQDATTTYVHSYEYTFLHNFCS